MPRHINPSFSIARRLVKAGHSVHYLSPDYKAAIEDTGATFLDARQYYDLYSEGRIPETFGAPKQLRGELGFPQTDGDFMVRVKVANIELEKKLGGVLRAILETKATTIVYDPVLCREAAVAGQIARVKVVGLLALRGHGAWAELVAKQMMSELPDIASKKARLAIFEDRALNKLNSEATQRLNSLYVPKGMKPLTGSFTGGRLDPIPGVCLVATTVAARAPQSPELVGSSKVVYVGALVDEAGALRADGPKTKSVWTEVEAKMGERSSEGKTILVSMGTSTTADGALGWQGKPNSSLTGEQVCQAVWGAVFDALGGEKGSGNVILCTVGKDSRGNPRPTAGSPPGNALCSPIMPEPDILRKGIDLFVTHGGHSSSLEAITSQTPMLCLPMVEDHIPNAEEAQKMGFGDRVSRPPPGDDDVDIVAVAAEYRAAVKDKILSMLGGIWPYKDAAVLESSRQRGGGVDEAVAVLTGAI